MSARKRVILGMGALAVSPFAHAQVPDLMNALEAGGRAMGIGGATGVTDSNTLSAGYNPAGLAYVTGPTFGMAVRNLPQSNNFLTGRYSAPDFATDRESGPRKLTHAGIALPLRGGVLGVSYTMGGFIHDFRTAASLTNGQSFVKNLVETLQAQTDFFNVSWGAKAGTLNYGFGIVIANQYVSDFGSFDNFDSNNQFSGSSRIDNSGNMHGVGAVAGVQFSPSNDNRSVVGLSVRTPIKLSRNDQVDPYINRLPGRASIGLATRRDGLRGGKDFLVYGAQLDYFFSSDKGGVFQRKDVLSGGAGAEYNFFRGPARIPVRIGYAVIPSGGDGFINRNTLTFGVGYRPLDSKFAVDLNFGLPSGGGTYDMGLSMTYRVGN